MGMRPDYPRTLLQDKNLSLALETRNILFVYLGRRPRRGSTRFTVLYTVVYFVRVSISFRVLHLFFST